MQSALVHVMRVLVLGSPDEITSGKLLDGPEFQVTARSSEPQGAALDALAVAPVDAVILRCASCDELWIATLASARPEIPLILAVSDDAEAASMIRAGAEDVVPIRRVSDHELARVVRHAVARRRRASHDLRHGEHGRAERKPLESEAEFRALVESSPAAILIVEDRKVRYVNPMLSAITECTARELLGTDPMELVDCDFRAEIEERSDDVRRAPRGGTGQKLECRIRTRDNEGRWLDLTLAPVVYQGRTALVWTGVDITDRKRLEARMIQSQRFETVGRLAGGIAQYFNNLLLVISGHAETLLETVGDEPRIRGSAEAIARAADRAASLTQQLLAFGRRQTLIPRSLDVNAVVRDMAGLLGPSIGDDVSVVTRLEEDLPPVCADRAQLEQVIVNLLTNAREAVPRGGTVTIATDTVLADDEMTSGRPWLTRGTYVRLKVSDTGTGIAPDVIPHVFEPFFTTKPHGAGTGLGLPAVYGIVKQSGGFLWVDSEPGQGAHVTILLPPLQLAADTAATLPRSPRANGAILVVDDEDGVRDLLTVALTRHGFRVRGAATADEAISIEQENDFDLLLTDVVLPKMTGPQLAAHIRGRSPDLPVLFMSGYTQDALQPNQIGGAAHGFIQKPFATRLLVQRIREMLGTT